MKNRHDEEMNSFDVLIVSGARPTLLNRTLESFEKNLFRNIRVGNCFINIDPFEGSDEEVEECEKICRGRFEQVFVNTPRAPHFTKAVKWLWSRPNTDWCIHLEDDWLLTRQISVDELLSCMTRRVTQISFMTKEKRWKYKSSYHFDEMKKTIFGVYIGRGLNKKRPMFGTSPSILSSNFARECSALMIDDLDPEKQLNKFNPKLNQYTSKFRNRFLGSINDHVAVDIGREHRVDKGIEKTLLKGQSIWIRK